MAKNSPRDVVTRLTVVLKKNSGSARTLLPRSGRSERGGGGEGERERGTSQAKPSQAKPSKHGSIGSGSYSTHPPFGPTGDRCQVPASGTGHYPDQAKDRSTVQNVPQLPLDSLDFRMRLWWHINNSADIRTSRSFLTFASRQPCMRTFSPASSFASPAAGRLKHRPVRLQTSPPAAAHNGNTVLGHWYESTVLYSTVVPPHTVLFGTGIVPGPPWGGEPMRLMQN